MISFSSIPVFISFVLLTLALIGTISLHDWVKTRRLSSRSIQKKLKRISQALSLQEWEQAEKELVPLLENGKGGKEAALFEIRILRGLGKLQEALEKIHAKSRLYPEELLFCYEEGLILLKLNKPHEALNAFQACSSILRGESDLFYLASALFQTGAPKECFDLLNPLLTTTQNGHLAALAGDALYELKAFSEAIARYNLALELGCTTHHVFAQLGHAFRRLGNLSEAEKIFRGLLEKDPHDIDATLGLGACLQERGHHHKALLIYQSALATKDLRLFQQAAIAALRAKKYRFAEAYFAEVLHKQGDDPHLLSCYALSMEHQKKWQEAEQIYLKLIQLFPAYPQGYRALAWLFGVGLSQTLSPEQGMHYAHLALKLKNDPTSWEILSACSARVGDFEKAYTIQLSLSKQDLDPQTRARRQQALRTLRKKMPLGDLHILRTQVA